MGIMSCAAARDEPAVRKETLAAPQVIVAAHLWVAEQDRVIGLQLPGADTNIVPVIPHVSPPVHRWKALQDHSGSRVRILFEIGVGREIWRLSQVRRPVDTPSGQAGPAASGICAPYCT